jgi:hypothetical protein
MKFEFITAKILTLVGLAWFVLDILSAKDFFDETMYSLILAGIYEILGEIKEGKSES